MPSVVPLSFSSLLYKTTTSYAHCVLPAGSWAGLAMALVLGREEELLAQLRALLTFLPPPASPPAPAAPVKVESIMGTSGGGRRLGSKRDRDDDSEAEAEQHGDEPAAAQPHYCPHPPPPCKRTRCVRGDCPSMHASSLIILFLRSR